MNPAFDCPYDSSLDDMVKNIESYDQPALLIDENGKVIARNSLADYKVAPVRIGGSIKHLLPGGEFSCISAIRNGEIKRIQLKTDKLVNAVAASFKGFYYIGWRLTRKDLLKTILDINSAVSNSALGVFNYCIELDTSIENDMVLMKQYATEQLRRQMNLGRMLEIITSTNTKPYKHFNPSTTAKAICNIVDEMLSDNHAVLITKLDIANEKCEGIEEDYCSALSSMVSFAVKHSTDGRILVKGTVIEKKYKLSVSFKSDINVKDIQSACSNKLRPDIEMKADLLYLRCIAENEAWGLGIDEVALGGIMLYLYVPLFKTGTMPLMQAMSKRNLASLVKAQLTSIDND